MVHQRYFTEVDVTLGIIFTIHYTHASTPNILSLHNANAKVYCVRPIALGPKVLKKWLPQYPRMRWYSIRDGGPDYWMHALLWVPNVSSRSEAIWDTHQYISWVGQAPLILLHAMVCQCTHWALLTPPLWLHTTEALVNWVLDLFKRYQATHIVNCLQCATKACWQ